jgi:hypothetical protein
MDHQQQSPQQELSSQDDHIVLRHQHDLEMKISYYPSASSKSFVFVTCFD